ncbi:MAG: hypothetical protein J7501_15975 [Bdellovibrio sp.]|nr:hypothetical protein [Bdellovibrio sp.]
MKKVFSVLAAVAATAVTMTAQADVKKPTLVCNFTEPFIQVIVLAKGQEVGMVGDQVAYRAVGKDTVLAAISGRSVKDGVTSLKLVGGGLDGIILDVAFGKEGSDGMSDKIYQSEGILKTAVDETIVYGGCDVVP